MFGGRLLTVGLGLGFSIFCGAQQPGSIPPVRQPADPSTNPPPKFLMARHFGFTAQPPKSFYRPPPEDADELTKQRFYLLGDTDKDGILDRRDSDIDGDGVLNFLDAKPFDNKFGGEDADADGLPDFVDFKNDQKLNFGSSEKLAACQLKLFSEFGYVIVSDDIFYNDDECRFFISELSSGLISRFAPAKISSLSVIVKTSTHSSRQQIHGNFDEDWKILYLGQYTPSEAHRFKFFAVFVHEFFHVIHSVHPEQVNRFMTTFGWLGQENASLVRGDDLPSAYAPMSLGEHFADAGCASSIIYSGLAANPLWDTFGYMLASYQYSNLHGQMLRGMLALVPQ